MKKIALALILVITLTGCGNKLKCTRTTKSDVMTQTTKYTISKDENKITKVVASEKYEIHNSDINENYDYLLSYRFEELKNNNINYEYTHKGNKYNITTTYDISNMSEEAIKTYIGTTDLNEYKNNLTQEGFICK